MSDSGREWPSEMSDEDYLKRFGEPRKPTAETHTYSDLGGYEPYALDDVLGEMVRDFTIVGGWRPKSEVRRRIQHYAETYHKLAEPEPPSVTSEAMRIFQMNRGDFEAECIKRGLEPLAFAQWIVYHWYASREPKVPILIEEQP